MLDAHRAGLTGLVRALESEGGGAALLLRLSEHEPARSLLALHGLHPTPLETRARQAVSTADEAAGKNGFAELISVVERNVAVRIRARTTAATDHLESLVDAAMAALAPEAHLRLQRDPIPEQETNLVPLERLRRAEAET
jgi:hypothetical protein